MICPPKKAAYRFSDGAFQNICFAYSRQLWWLFWLCLPAAESMPKPV